MSEGGPRRAALGGPSPPADATPRLLGGLSAFVLVAGSMVGVGIFVNPPVVARHVADPALFLGLWALGGLVSLAGAVAYAELGALFPHAGGDVTFQRAAFGESVAFASGWVLFGATFTGSVAALAVALGDYQLPVILGVPLDRPLVPLPGGGSLDGARLVALAVVAGLTVLNGLGVRQAAWVQALTTLVPLAALGLLAALVLGDPAAHALPAAAPRAEGHGLAASYLVIYFAYSGWNAVVYVAGEVRDPARAIPRALVGGTLVVTALYVALCAAFLRGLGPDGLAGAGEAGSALARARWGPGADRWMALLIALGILSSLNATVLGGARVAWAMARDGALHGAFLRLDPRHHVPRRALWLQAAVAAAYIVTGTFEQIAVMTGLAMVAVGSLSVAALYTLRRRAPDAPRPWRALGYPWLPALYLLASAAVVGTVLAEAATGGGDEGAYPLAGLLILVLAWAAHRLRVAFRRPRPDPGDR